jgi:protein O-GlcNAc transferase
MENYNAFVELYSNAEQCKDPVRSNEMFVECIVKSTDLITEYDKLNYLQVFRNSEQILNVYFKNAQLLVRTVGLNDKSELTEIQNMTLQTAVHRLRKCLSVDPMNVDVNNLFRSLFIYLARFLSSIKEKITYLKQVLMINPVDYELHLHLGIYYMTINDLDNALLHYKNCWGILNLLPSSDINTKVKCLNNIGSIYSAIQDRNLAEYYFKAALEIKPNDPDINNQLGALHTELRNTEIAIKYYKAGISCVEEATISEDKKTLLASLYMNMGMAYCYECDFNTAISCYNTSLKHKPNLSLAYQNKLLDLNYISHEITDPMYISKSHKAINKIYPKVITEIDSKYNVKREVLKLNNTVSFENKVNKLKKSNTKINIGFVSGDFLHHPVSYFINAILKYLNQDIFDIYCFSGKTMAFPSKDEVLGHCHWIITKNMTSVQLCELIKSHSIDILFDLSAHTGDNRLDTFVLKPAPIQISYCGYPGSSGINSMDYHITDSICDSQETQKYYTEKLVFMKNCFLSYTPPTELPAITKVQPCIKNKYITFGTFNRLNKINSVVIDTWKQILIKIPNCKLVIKTREFSTEKLKQNFLSNFSEMMDRIQVLEHRDLFEQHMNDYNTIDISLDTFPYSGTTTSCESLAMGVPIVTLYDNIRNYHSQNVTSSLLINSDLDDFVTYSREDYIQKCIDLSETMDTLVDLKQTIQDKFKNGNVCNREEFAKEFGNQLLGLYKNHSWKML